MSDPDKAEIVRLDGEVARLTSSVEQHIDASTELAGENAFLRDELRRVSNDLDATKAALVRVRNILARALDRAKQRALWWSEIEAWRKEAGLE